MLDQIDRVQLAVPDMELAASGWRTLLGAEEISRDKVAALGAKRLTLRAGHSDVEIVEPDGTGLVDAALRRRGRAHLFAAGVSTPDLAALEKQLAAQGVTVAAEHGQLHLGLEFEGTEARFVASETAERAPAGDIDFLYEATLLTGDYTSAVDQFVRVFGIAADRFKPIKSEHFGYEGTLTLFQKEKLHRFEVISPTDMSKTMGRYFDRTGASYYMAFAECPNMLKVEERAKEVGAGITVERPEGRAESKTPDQMWLHPPALGGMMLGLSRPSMAWTWSGYPERVEAVA